MVAVEEEFSASIRRSVDPPGGVSMVTLQARGQTLMLLPEKAVFLPDSDTLLVADAHIGQAPGVRHHGVPAPGGTTEASLGILTRLIRRLDARRIVFLGEFLHSALALEPSTLASVRRWRELHGAVELTLIRGSHDGQGLDPPAMLDVQVFDAPLMHRGLTLTYQPRWVEADFVIGGHLHPCVSVRGRTAWSSGVETSCRVMRRSTFVAPGKCSSTPSVSTRDWVAPTRSTSPRPTLRTASRFNCAKRWRASCIAGCLERTR